MINYKCVLLLLIMSLNQVNAGDPASGSDTIFVNGFDQVGYVRGTVSGIMSEGLTLELRFQVSKTRGTLSEISEIVSISEDGEFWFRSPIAVGIDFTVSIKALPHNPTQQSCSHSSHEHNEYLTMSSPAGYSGYVITCNNTAWNWDEMNWDEGGWN